MISRGRLMFPIRSCRSHPPGCCSDWRLLARCWAGVGGVERLVVISTPPEGEVLPFRSRPNRSASSPSATMNQLPRYGSVPVRATDGCGEFRSRCSESLRRNPFQARDTDAFEIGQQRSNVKAALVLKNFRRRNRQRADEMFVIIHPEIERISGEINARLRVRAVALRAKEI